MKKFAIGICDFEELIKGNFYYIDKTLLIKEIMDDGAKVILLTRPRRFGKTLNLSMLHYFLSENYYKVNKTLFDGLDISKDVEFCKEHQGQYPVIFISFKDIKKATFPEAYAGILELIRKLYVSNNYLLEGDMLLESEKRIFNNILDKKADREDIESSIKNLAEYMKKKFKKYPIILIDEYDTPILEGYLNEYYKEIISLMRGILGQALKGNTPGQRFLKKAIVTGITRIAQESLFSGVNNFDVFSVLQEKYGQYFGFSEEEVLKLMDDSDQKIELGIIKEWYNGYQMGKYLLYNPWSIIKCFKNNGALDPYWLNTASADLIARLLKNADPEVKQQLEELLQGNIIERPISENLIFPDIEASEEALWSLFLHAGYLKMLSKERFGNRLMAKLAIPNKEVSFVYDEIIDKWFRKIVGINSYPRFVQNLANGDMEKFKEYLSSYIIQAGSYFEFSSKTSEQIFHVFILGLVVGLRDHYSIHSNQESGLGRCDVIFIPKDKQKNGIILEFKTCPSEDLLVTRAQEALEQIRNKNYIEIFKQQNIDSVLAIGLAFFGKKMELVHENIHWTNTE